MEAIINARIYTEDKVIQNGYIEYDEKIIAFGEGEYSGQAHTIDAQGNILMPGFIDIHIHGGYGADAMDATPEALEKLTQGLLQEGTTSFLPTTMTESLSRVTKALSNIATFESQGAEILGIHLEGPFISEHKVGAQDPQYVMRPSIQLIDQLQQAAQNKIKIITIAPEVEGAMDVIQHFDTIIFSAGHTIATFDEMNHAQTLGLKHITHLYNAATGFNHRNPGAFGAAWLNEGLKTECIVDGVHSHPAAVDIAYRLKGNNAFMVITDAMRAKGLGDGESELGGQKVNVLGNEARLDDGTLAGSVLKMNEGLKYFVEFTGESLDNASRVMSYNQAVALGVDDRIGSISLGKQADFVLIDNEFNVLSTVKKGYNIYNNKK
ncbi:N-acetylglucosamine-6-phosphate deacetylase [Macrococcoides caseolyticum]|uniref:N-acetylglucosamine-6-phosphate deacetylase n=1 Tax=Macrococcoides caseolyticum TaxID=69966 RepID=UPI001F35D64C|nr:N-acetylglucosamine-6-phosphate deacetylase [Macrococcus caseolyticus]MCE4957643.1 N-acetylglucosamine-6-phosphate deacetylase [Macrococcus caseolyticus]